MAFQIKTIWFVLTYGAALSIVLILLFLPGFVILKFILIILAAILNVVAYSTRYFSYMFEPLFKMKNKLAILDGDDAFTIAPSGNAILIREGADIYATAFVKIPIYVSATEMEDADKNAFANMCGRVIALSRDPIRISSELYVINKDQYMESIKTKLNMAEDRYNTLMNTINAQGPRSRDSVQSSEADRIRGELTMWRNMADSVSKAKSQSLVTYGAVTSVGATEEEALNLALLRADEFAAGASAILGVSATIVTGQEILPLIEPDYMIPIQNVNERLKAKNIDQGV